jgi:NAD+ diphosphatase
MVPRHALPHGLDSGLFLGEADDRPLWSIEAAADGEAWTPLRPLLAEASADQAKAAVRAAELAAWRRDHRYCGACGTATVRREDQVAFDCPSCGSEFWPRVTPAVIMLVHRGDEVLLARNARFRASPMYSCLAGFVEAGETLEEAVAREVAEEVGVTVGRPTYVDSQAWPFPHALMVGFFAPWESGEPVPDGNEIVDAGWYRRDRLPELPFPHAIARRLIRTYFKDDTL